MSRDIDELRDRFMQAEGTPTYQDLIDVLKIIETVEAEADRAGSSARMALRSTRREPLT